MKSTDTARRARWAAARLRQWARQAVAGSAGKGAYLWAAGAFDALALDEAAERRRKRRRVT